MELVAARPAAEPEEEHPAAALAEGEREEGFSDKVVRYGGRDGEDVGNLHLDLFAVEEGNVRVPRQRGLCVEEEKKRLSFGPRSS